MIDEKDIEKEVEIILKDLYEKLKNEDGNIKKEKIIEVMGGYDAINWGDLHCVSAQMLMCVDIEEVSPDAHNLKNYVRNELKKKHPDIVFKINTEW
jgi:hypothetical protein